MVAALSADPTTYARHSRIKSVWPENVTTETKMPCCCTAGIRERNRGRRCGRNSVDPSAQTPLVCKLTKVRSKSSASRRTPRSTSTRAIAVASASNCSTRPSEWAGPPTLRPNDARGDAMSAGSRKSGSPCFTGVGEKSGGRARLRPGFPGASGVPWRGLLRRVGSASVRRHGPGGGVGENAHVAARWSSQSS